MALLLTGPLSEPLATLRSALASSTVFQAIVGAADAAEAAEKIFYHSPPPSPAGGYPPAYFIALRPFAVLSYPERAIAESNHVATGSSFKYSRAGRVILEVYANAINNEHNKYDAELNAVDWGNVIGGIIEHLEDLAGTPAGLAATTIGVDVMMANCTDTAEGQGRFNVARLTLSYDAGGRS